MAMVLEDSIFENTVAERYNKVFSTSYLWHLFFFFVLFCFVLFFL
jgi:hypothetical protein